VQRRSERVTKRRCESSPLQSDTVCELTTYAGTASQTENLPADI
jgi:hypothetical protein